MSNNCLINKVASFIKQNNLLDNSKKYIVALSGGADSVSLLLILHQLCYNIEAAHCNFHLRGNDSNDDEDFCKTLCERLDITLHIKHFNTEEYSSSHKISIEMAARELRYNYFNTLAIERNAEGICVAHHINDVAETMLLNLVRGSGIKGLQGILPHRDNIIRPLLCVTRNEIEDFLISKHQDFKQDFTNFDDEINRNRLRINVIPQLEKINNASIFSMQKTAKRMVDAEQLINIYIEEQRNKIVRQKDSFVSFNIADIINEYFLYLLIKEYDFSSAQIENIYSYIRSPQTGKVFSSYSHDLLIDRNQIIIRKKTDYITQPIIINSTGTYNIAENKTLTISFEDLDKNKSIPKSSNICFADADVIKFPLTLRRTRQGDRFIPFGMKQSKLVSDYLTDKKRNLFQKESQLVVTDNEEKIVWLVDERIDNRIRITDKTKHIIKIIYE